MMNKDQLLSSMRARLESLTELVRSQVAEIEADSRYHDDPALVDVNAPLALIQVEMQARMSVLRQVERICAGEDGKPRGKKTKRRTTP